MAVLYKYLSGESALKTLRSMSLLAGDPMSFNDPFEVRPVFDQARHDAFAQDHESQSKRRWPFSKQFSLLENRSMVGIPTENALDFGDGVHASFRDRLCKRYRVLCLSKTFESVLMWGHYATCEKLKHGGIVLGINTSAPEFPSGIRRDGFSINYTDQRVGLPIAYYRGVSVELLDPYGNIANDPDEVVKCGGGIEISFREYWRLMEEAEISLLTTKAESWEYEEEVRFIYEPRNDRAVRIDQEKRCFVPIHPGAVTEVIVGARTPEEIVKAICDAHKTEKLGAAKLYLAGFHPFLYKMIKQEVTSNYLLNICPVRNI
ncbi:MAG: hypothetical protein U1G08_19995 [Verrucomicrobiota bacterium]